MKIKSVSARIIGQRYSGSLSQADEGGQSLFRASGYDNNASQLFQTSSKSQAHQDKAMRGHENHDTCCLRNATATHHSSPQARGVHPDTTHTTASLALQNS